MTDLLGRISAAIDGLCPCGAEPRDGSAYCSEDCVPNYRGIHTSSDTDGTQMRWRPDLVSAVDDSDLLDLGSCTFYEGRYHARLFQRGIPMRAGPVTWHLRLDDGHRFVGLDLPGVTDILGPENEQRVADSWASLERELTNSRHTEPDLSIDPWARFLDSYRAMAASVIPRIDAMVLGHAPVQAVELNYAGEAAAERFSRIADEGSGAAEASSPTVEFDNRHGRFIPLSNAAEALRRAFAGVGEALRVVARESALTEPEHPMLQVIEQRRNRNTGPEQHHRAPRQINPRRAR